jgi:signal transduction histidine kinase
MKQLFTGVLCAVVITSCANSEVYPSISSISVSWLKLKFDIINSKQDDGLEGSIENFRITLNKFLSSPLTYLYRIHRPENIQILKDIDSAVDSLNGALKDGDYLTVFPIILEIDSSLEQLHLIEKNLSETSQLQYFQLFFFLCMLIISIVLALWALYSRFEKAEKREKQSLAFSRETILAQERERSRIARELHDTVAQDILQLSLQTEIMNKEADTSKRNLLCGEIVGGQREIMKRIRNICENLIPPDFQSRRLGEALQTLCYNFQQRTNIECQIKIQKDLPFAALNSDIQLQCFRIVQECLNNIEKHSKAAEASVLVYSGDKREFIISVSDDGKGLSSSPHPHKKHNDFSIQSLKEQGCLGLWGMYERAAAMNGELTLESEPGEGTTVTLRISQERTI